MDVIIWRHAEAEESGARSSDLANSESKMDLQRELTALGRQQAKAGADWLRPRLPSEPLVLVSPATRAQQTAALLELPFMVDPRLAPGARVVDLLTASGWPDHSGACLLVGHQPTLGRMAAYLLTGKEAYWSIKKGALIWFSSRKRGGNVQTSLRAAITPDLLIDL